MAIITELFHDRNKVLSAESPRIEIHYVVEEALDEIEVEAAAIANLPLTKDGLSKRTITIDERVNETTWKIIVVWEFQSFDLQQGESSFSFDTGGGSQHITQSLSTVAMYGPHASSLLGGAIGYDGENIQGVDITVPVYNFSESHVFDDSMVTNSYKQELFSATGKVNSLAFKGFAAGEVLFLGATGSKRGDDDWEISFRFSASQNKTNLTVGDITGITKKGWEYLWVQYAKDVDDTKKVILKKPVAVYIEKVYDEASFSSLGIGV